MIDAQCIGNSWPKQLEHASGTGADIEQIAWRERGDNIGERGLDFGLIDIQGADSVPIRRIFSKIRGGQFSTLTFDRRKPLQIERDRLVMLRRTRPPDSDLES